MFILGGDYTMFPRVRLLQKISSLAQLLSFQPLPQILDPSLRAKSASQVSYPVEGFLSYLMNRFPQNIELTLCQFNLLMNLNTHLFLNALLPLGSFTNSNVWFSCKDFLSSGIAFIHSPLCS